MKQYLCCALGAAVFFFIVPWLWRHVAINAIGYEAQGALVVGLGALIGGLVADRIGWKR